MIQKPCTEWATSPYYVSLQTFRYLHNLAAASYVGENKVFEQMHVNGDIELELTPQGTLAERCRAGGAGIPAFYTPAAFGIVVQTGELPLEHNSDGTVRSYSKLRDVKVFDGKSYVMEEAIRGDYALSKRGKRTGLEMSCPFRCRQFQRRYGTRCEGDHRGSRAHRGTRRHRSRGCACS